MESELIFNVNKITKELTMSKFISFFLMLSFSMIQYVNAARGNFPSKVPENWPEDLKKLVKQIRTSRTERRVSAINKLGDMKEKAIPAAPWLTPLLTDNTKVKVRHYTKGSGASYMLVTTSIEAVTRAALNKIFAGRPDDLVALYERKDTANRDRLLSMISGIKTPKAKALFAKALASPSERTRILAIHFADTACWKRQLLELLDKDPSKQVRIAAANNFAQNHTLSKAERSKIFAKYINDHEPRIQGIALNILCTNKDQRALKGLTEILHSGNAAMVQNSIRYAFQYGNEGRKLIVDTLKKYPKRREALLKTRIDSYIGKSNDSELLMIIIDLMSDKDPGVSTAAYFKVAGIKMRYSRFLQDELNKSLGNLKKFKAGLKHLLVQGDKKSKRMVLYNNVRYFDESFIPLVEKLKDDPDKKIQRYAAKCLKTIKKQ